MGWDSWDKHVEYCGCTTESRSNDWNQHQERDVSYCEKHTKRVVKYRKIAAEARIYNKPIRLRLQELNKYLQTINAKHLERLERKLSEKEEMLLPIKYYYEMKGCKNIINSLDDDDMRRFKVQKIKSRYYCCKNRVDYYFKWMSKENIRKEQLERKKNRFISTKGWTEEDLTLKSEPYYSRDSYFHPNPARGGGKVWRLHK